MLARVNLAVVDAATITLANVRALCRNFFARGNDSVGDRLKAQATGATGRCFLRSLVIERCVLVDRVGFPRPELLRDVLAEPARDLLRNLSSRATCFRSLAASFCNQLSFSLKPIGFRVARQCKPASAFGDEICPEANYF